VRRAPGAAPASRELELGGGGGGGDGGGDDDDDDDDDDDGDHGGDVDDDCVDGKRVGGEEPLPGKFKGRPSDASSSSCAKEPK
jgi:hypothetical protein